jgi:hypothetical protein
MLFRNHKIMGNTFKSLAIAAALVAGSSDVKAE